MRLATPVKAVEYLLVVVLMWTMGASWANDGMDSRQRHLTIGLITALVLLTVARRVSAALSKPTRYPN